MDKQLKTVAVYNQYVDEYVNKFMHFDLYNDTFDFLESLLSKNSSVIELGCGPGNVIHYLSNKRPDLEFLGIDLAPEMINRAREINPNATFEISDIRDIKISTNKFDAVIGAFCLPYLSNDDLDGFFSSLNTLTNDKGIVYLSCMEGELDKSGFEKTSFTGDNELYIYYHQRVDLECKLRANGFVVDKFYTKDYPESDGSTTTDLIFIAKKINVV